MALDMPQIDDIRRLWSEGRGVSKISRMTGHDRKTVSARQKHHRWSLQSVHRGHQDLSSVVGSGVKLRGSGSKRVVC